MNPAHKVAEKFESRFGRTPRVFRAPGRVNVIGEHTDYNQGLVMPAAIGLSAWAAASPREDRNLVVVSANLGAEAEICLDRQRQARRGDWSDYVCGVAVELELYGRRLRGMDLMIDSEVPIGAGLSSSASLEVASALALAALSGHVLEPTELALLCQRAENEFVGARCGVMDQFIACNARAGHVIRLDCRDLSFQFAPLPPAVRLVVANTMIQHDMAAGKYNKRRTECEQALGRLRLSVAVESLRDVTLDDLAAHREDLSKTQHRRARHVVTENARVAEAEEALDKEDAEKLGRLISASHVSLRDDYEVSCPELDLLAGLLEAQPGVYGARMMGGGFGGSVIALAAEKAAAGLEGAVAPEYEDRTSLKPWFYVCETADAAGEAEL